MLVNGTQFEILFQKIQQIREEVQSYVLGGDDLYVSIDNLHAMIMQMYSLNITLYEATTSVTKHFTSLVLRYDARADIIFPSTLLERDRRFAVAKELMHLVLDEREDWSIDAKTTIDGIIEIRELEWRGITDHEAQPVVVCEHLAEMAAVELLYPKAHREQNGKDIEAGNLTYSKLALQLKLPVRAVRLAHVPWYQAICKKYDTC